MVVVRSQMASAGSRARSRARHLHRRTNAAGASLQALVRSVVASEALLRRNLALEHLSRTDDLTGIHNRRFIDERLRYELADASRRGEPLTALILDVDNFKSINDRHGHLAGDLVLREVARRLEGSLRRHDLLGRWGGEEFLVVAPRTGTEAGLAMAERVRMAVARSPVVVGSRAIHLTVSGGAATTDGDDAHDLLRRADAGLYLAKRAGRNRVVFCDRTDPTDDG